MAQLDKPNAASVLVVDDDEKVLSVLKRILQKPFAVTAVQDAGAALELLEQNHYDVVVSDIVMPQMDGISLLKAVRKTRANLPVIFLTGLPSMETAVYAVELGAYSYLTKPFESDQLIETVQAASEHYRSTQQTCQRP